MNLARRAQVIHLLLRQANLQRDGLIDAHAQAAAKLRESTEKVDACRRDLLGAQDAVRHFIRAGDILDVRIYFSATIALSERKRELANAVSQVDLALVDVKKVQSEMLNHQKRIRKLEEIGKGVSAMCEKEVAAAFSRHSDDLWLSRTQEHRV